MEIPPVLPIVLLTIAIGGLLMIAVIWETVTMFRERRAIRRVLERSNSKSKKRTRPRYD